MPAGAQDEPTEQEQGERDGHEGPHAGPPPVVALDDGEGERGETGREQRRPANVRQPPTTRCPALDQGPSDAEEGRDADREVDEERQPPASDADERASDRRPEAG